MQDHGRDSRILKWQAGTNRLVERVRVRAQPRFAARQSGPCRVGAASAPMPPTTASTVQIGSS